MTSVRDDQPDLLSDLSDLDFVRHLLADLHDDLPGKVGRFRMLTDLGGQMGRSGTMIFGGHAAYHAWVEARSSFVHGNYVATILLCQGLVEHLLAAYLHAGLLVDDIPDRIQFADTLRRCREREVVSDEARSGSRARRPRQKRRARCAEGSALHHTASERSCA